MPERRPPASAAAARLSELAEVEAAELKERQRARDAAIRHYDTAQAAITDAEAAMASARAQQAVAITALLESGLDVNAVATVVGLDPRRVREVRSAKRASQQPVVAEGS